MSFGLELLKWDRHFSLKLLWWVIDLPWRARTPPVDDLIDVWGVSVDLGDCCVHLNWADRTKILWLPWLPERVKEEVLLSDGSYVQPPDIMDYETYQHHPHRPMSPWSREVGSDVWVGAYPFRARDSDNNTYPTTAYVTVKRSTWVWRSLKWLGWPRKTRTYIEVAFADEVGAGVGSWKGGTVGCSQEMRANETPAECLWRMQRDRVFD